MRDTYAGHPRSRSFGVLAILYGSYARKSVLRIFNSGGAWSNFGLVKNPRRRFRHRPSLTGRRLRRISLVSVFRLDEQAQAALNLLQRKPWSVVAFDRFDMAEANTYFLPGYGISRSVIQSEIRYFCGPDAIVRPFTHKV